MGNVAQWFGLGLGLALLVASQGGCTRKAETSTSPSKADKPLDLVEHFRKTQTSTMTTHGKVKKDSVAGQDGKIYYETEDGKAWLVEPTMKSDGTPHYGSPQEAGKGKK